MLQSNGLFKIYLNGTVLVAGSGDLFLNGSA